ncbi:MAG: helix-turn-helix domain-containing protein [Planctomycetota bacterium]
MAIATKKRKAPSDGGLATIVTVAAYLDVSRAKVYQMMDRGELAYVKLGKSRRVPWEAVIGLVKSSTVNGQPEQG